MEKRIYNYHGEMRTITELCKLSGKTYGCIMKRLQKGWTVDEAVDRPSVRIRQTDAPCGFKTFRDCLDCKYPECISEGYKAIPGESVAAVMKWNGFDFA